MIIKDGSKSVQFYKDFRKFVSEKKVPGTTLDSYVNKTYNDPSMLGKIYSESNAASEIIASATPYVVEQREMRVSQIDIFSRLSMDRILFLNGGVTEDSCNILSSQFLFLTNADSQKDIDFFISSGGGSVMHGTSLQDVIRYIPNKVNTMCIGIAASMGAILLTGGTGVRSILPHSRVMIHQPLGGSERNTQASDLRISMKLMDELENELYTIISETTGKSIDQVREDCHRDNWMTAQKALDYGLVDKIVEVSYPKRNK